MAGRKKADASTRNALNHLLRDGILVTGAQGAAKVLASTRGWAILSLRDEGIEPLWADPLTVGPRLSLSFDDVTVVTPSIARRYTPCTQEDASRIVSFARELAKDPPVGLVVHCEQGVSRSTAAAVGVVAALLGPGNEIIAVRRMLDYVKAAYDKGLRTAVRVQPNLRLAALLDIELGSGGNLVRAIVDSFYRRFGSYDPDTLIEQAKAPIPGARRTA